jgi:hypothetical protein
VRECAHQFYKSLDGLTPLAERELAGLGATFPGAGRLDEEQAETVSLLRVLQRQHGYLVLEAATSAHACGICALSMTEIDLLITDVERKG